MLQCNIFYPIMWKEAMLILIQTSITSYAYIPCLCKATGTLMTEPSSGPENFSFQIGKSLLNSG